MKKWFLILILLITLTSIISAETIKVAVLPLKRLDSASKYIQKFLTIRDLQHTFDKNAKYEMIDLKQTAEAFKDMAIDDLDTMEKEDMAEIGKELKADLVVLGIINARNQQVFSIQFRYYSMRTDNVVSRGIEVGKEKRKRWTVLEKDFLGSLTDFFDGEINKLFTLAIQDYHSENYKKAEQGFNNVLQFIPGSRKSHYYLGQIAYNQKNYPKAVSEFNKALPDTLSNADVSTLQSLSNAYRDMGNKEMMLSTLERLASIQEDEELWLRVANLYAENNMNVKARESLVKALKIEPKYLNAQIRMAFLLFDMANYSEAILYLEIAANSNPDNDLIARRLAFSYQKAGMINEAITRYENMIQADPTNLLAYLNLAGIYRTAAAEEAEKNNTVLVNEYNQKALNTIIKLKAVDPENALVYIRLADVYLAMNNFRDAEANALTAMNKDSAMYQPFIILGTINQRRGTEQYNIYVDRDKQFQKAIGREANRLAKERDAARLSANSFFKRADEQLKSAKSKTSEPEIILDLDGKLTALVQLISQTSKIN